MRLEGTLNQIRLQCPGRMTDLEVQQHLKDHLFHRVCKHIRDSMQYLYSNPETFYSQLMIATCKAESKNEETNEKVRSRTAMITNPKEGTMDLGHQIAKLMATLTRASQGNSPANAPNSPSQRLWESTDRQEHYWPTQAPIMAKLAWDRLPWSAVHMLLMAQGPQVKTRDRMPKGPKIDRRALLPGGIPDSSNISGARVGATWLGNVPPQPSH